MKPIVIDFLRRWMGIYLALALLQFCLSLFAPPSASFFALLTVIYAGPVLLSFDLARGTARVCRILPLSAVELANSWRAVAIVLPIVWLIVVFGAGTLLRIVFQIGAAPALSQLSLAVVYAGIWLGVAFHILTHMPNATCAPQQLGVKGGFIGGLWGACIGGGVILFMKLPTNWGAMHPWHWALLCGGFISTILGWQRAPEMVRQRERPLNAVEGIPNSEKSRIQLGQGSTGLSFLMQTQIWQTARVMGIFLFVFLGLQIFMQKSSQEPVYQVLTRILRQPINFFILAPMIMATGLPWLMALRSLRVLPLGLPKLTILVASLFLGPVLIMLLAFASIQAGLSHQTISYIYLGKLLWITAPVLLAPGLLLYYGLNQRSYAFVILPLFALAPLGGLLTDKIATPWQLLICLAGWAFGLGLIKHALKYRNESYRHSFNWMGRT